LEICVAFGGRNGRGFVVIVVLAETGGAEADVNRF
jgi:hypothetical protein